MILLEAHTHEPQPGPVRELLVPRGILRVQRVQLSAGTVHSDVRNGTSARLKNSPEFMEMRK